MFPRVHLDFKHTKTEFAAFFVAATHIHLYKAGTHFSKHAIWCTTTVNYLKGRDRFRVFHLHWFLYCFRVIPLCMWVSMLSHESSVRRVEFTTQNFAKIATKTIVARNTIFHPLLTYISHNLKIKFSPGTCLAWDARSRETEKMHSTLLESFARAIVINTRIAKE